jgi:proteasome lid subunit RPN8/RPN11
MHIEVTREVIERLVSQAAAAHPRECCGILFGSSEHISSAVAAPNVHQEPETHFEIDPQTLIDAYRAERRGGPEVIGFYHSHPIGEAIPSATDRALAARDGRIWAIIAAGQVRFWQDCPQGFMALSYEVVGA